MLFDPSVAHIAAAGLLFCVAAVTTYGVVRLGILDNPNHRSSHDRPTPSSGGLGIVAAVAVGFALIWFFSEPARSWGTALTGFAVAALGVAMVGYIDDLKLLASFRTKLAVQIGAAVLLTVGGVVITRVPVPGVGMVDLGWAGYPLTVLWVVALTNMFNFMDGLNGLAAGTAVIAGSFFCAVTLGDGAGFVYLFGYVIAAGAAGFLVFNFPNARIFMGDVGSQFLGFSFAALAVIAAEIDASRVTVLLVPLLLFNFLYDTTFTLMRRALRGENVTKAHRTHLYQLMNRLGYSHVRVSLFQFAVVISQGAGAIALARHVEADDAAALSLVFVPYLLFQLAYTAWILRRARAAGLLADAG